MITYNTVEQIYSQHHGSFEFFKRVYCPSLIYTEGLMDFQQKLNAFWFVELVISYMPVVIKTFKEHEETFYVVQILLNQKQEGYFEIYREGYIDGKYQEHIRVAKQDISYIDLPTEDGEETTSYKFFLELSSVNPTVFTLCLPLER